MKTVSRLFFVCILLSSILNAQFITAPGYNQNEGYENYGVEGYENYSRDFLTIKQYDDFGNYIFDGLNVLNLSHSPIASFGSSVDKYAEYFTWFQQLVVSTDKYRGLSSTIVIGDAVRSKFSPYTLDLSRFNGFRYDGYTSKNRFTFITSRMSDPLWSTVRLPTISSRGYHSQHSWATYLLGGHWETEIGDKLLLGGTLINLSQMRTGREVNESSLRGTVPVELRPRTFILVFGDDSPEDGEGGAYLYSVPEIRIHGKWQKMTPALPYNFPYACDGSNSAVFAFSLSDSVQDLSSVQFRAVVANDYSISYAHQYQTDPLDPTKVKMTDLVQAVRAKGNVKDQSNKQMVVFNYSMNSGMRIAGLDFSGKILGINFRGEYLLNYKFSQYPSYKGTKYTRMVPSWYIQTRKRYGLLEIGYERFNIDPEYTTYLDIYSVERQPYWVGGRAWDYQNPTNLDTGSIRMNLVDDNDDDDRYPDGYINFLNDQAGDYSATGSPYPGEVNQYQSQFQYYSNGNEIFDRTNPQPDAGIFPGLDENNDGIPDDDQNSNGEPDYYEHFMMFYRNNPQFDFGDDWNNNGFIDEREDDMRPDLPYLLDLKGYHAFIRLVRLKYLNLAVGRFRQAQIAGGGINNVDYFRLMINIDKPMVGAFSFYWVPKKVEDTIKDPVFAFNVQTSSLDLYDDPLYYKNSISNTFFTKLRYVRFRNLNAQMQVKFEQNRMLKTDYQPSGKIHYLAWVFPRIEYRFSPFENLWVYPQFKMRSELKTLNITEKVKLQHIDEMIPIIRIDYRLTSATIFRIGFQGFPFFPYRIRDHVNPQKDRNDRIFLATISNTTNYQGYNLWIYLGYKTEKRDFLDKSIQDKNIVSLFLRVAAGF